MNKILLITEDIKCNEQNKDLVNESVSFMKSIASMRNISYSQIANLKYNEGLLKKMITTYIDASNFQRTANIVFDTPTNVSNFNKFFPKNSNTEFYKDIFETKSRHSLSS